MSEIKYVIGSGMHPHEGNQEQLSRWLWAIRRHAHPAPERIYLLCVGGSEPNQRNKELATNLGLDLRVIKVEGNRQHIGALLNGTEQSYLGGWSVGVLTLAMIAYADKRDMLYIESDCINTGPFVEKAYEELGDGGMIYGGKMDSAPYMAVSQSLILLREWFMPDFVGRYVGHGDERDVSNLPENSFHEMREQDGRIRTFGPWVRDRMRPIDFTQLVISAQKLSQEELEDMEKRGFL